MKLKVKARDLFPLAVCGVYIWWRGDVPLYVGIAKDSMLGRIAYHHHVIGIGDEIQIDDEIEFMQCSSHKEAQKIELSLIRKWMPRFNKACNPQWTQAQVAERVAKKARAKESKEKSLALQREVGAKVRRAKRVLFAQVAQQKGALENIDVQAFRAILEINPIYTWEEYRNARSRHTREALVDSFLRMNKTYEQFQVQ